MANAPSIFRSDDTFKIDDQRGIIAAGPIVRIDCGALGEIFRRAVLRINYEGSRYRIDIQTIDHDGNHENFDPAAGLLSDDYQAAFLGWMKRCFELQQCGYAYHDSGSDNLRIHLSLVED